MSTATWRWLAIALLAINLVVLLLHRLDSPAQQPEQSGLPPLNPDWPRVALVNEVAGLGPSEADAVQVPEERAAAEAPLEYCYSIGPLPTLLAQQRAQERLRPFASALRERQTVADRERGWWVYLPATSRQAALELTRDLTRRGVEDYFIIADGDMANNVSVGLYENLDNARARQSRLRALGFDAQLEVRRESTPQFWVDYRIPETEQEPWRFILDASPGAQRLQIPCFED